MHHFYVVASGGSEVNYGVYNVLNSSPDMREVFVSVSGGNTNAGIYNFASSPRIWNLFVTAFGASTSYGINNSGASLPLINNAEISASGSPGVGVFNNLSTSQPRIYNSIVDGSTYSIQNSGSAKAEVAYTQLMNVVNGSNFNCIGAFGTTLNQLTADCTIP
jgi:hypothetical protein